MHTTLWWMLVCKQGFLLILESRWILIVLNSSFYWMASGLGKRSVTLSTQWRCPMLFHLVGLIGTDVTNIPESMQYLGPAGGGIVSLSSSLTRACVNWDIIELWSFYITDKILEYIANETNWYGNGTWVCKVSCQEWMQLAAGDKNDGDATRDCLYLY